MHLLIAIVDRLTRLLDRLLLTPEQQELMHRLESGIVSRKPCRCLKLWPETEDIGRKEARNA